MMDNILVSNVVDPQKHFPRGYKQSLPHEVSWVPLFMGNDDVSGCTEILQGLWEWNKRRQELQGFHFEDIRDKLCADELHAPAPAALWLFINETVQRLDHVNH